MCYNSDVSKRLLIFFVFIVAIVDGVALINPNIKDFGFGTLYLTFHTISQSVVAAISLFLGLQCFKLFRQSGLLNEIIIGCGFILSAAFDILHALAYGGMPTTVIFPSVNTSELFWFAARFIFVFNLIFGFFLTKKVGKIKTRIGVAIAIVSFFILGLYSFAIFWGTDIPVQATISGPSHLKTINEYIIMILFLISGILYYYRYKVYKEIIYNFFVFLIISILAELNLTFHSGSFYFINWISHLMTILAYIVLLFQFRSLKRLQQVETDMLLNKMQKVKLVKF